MGKGKPHEDCEKNEVTFPSEHNIRILNPGGRACYLPVTEAPHKSVSLRMSREETFCFYETIYQSGGRPRKLRRASH